MHQTPAPTYSEPLSPSFVPDRIPAPRNAGHYPQSGQEVRLYVVHTAAEGVKRIRLRLFDNRAAELAEWDNEMLARIVAEMAISGVIGPGSDDERRSCDS